jgi:hypothetical protein
VGDRVGVTEVVPLGVREGVGVALLVGERVGDEVGEASARAMASSWEISVFVASAEEVVSLSNFFVDLGSVPVQTAVWNFCGAPYVVVSLGFQFPGSLPPLFWALAALQVTHVRHRHSTPPSDSLIVCAGMLLAPRSNVTLLARQQLPDHPFLRVNNDAPPTTKLDWQPSWSGLPLACILKACCALQ